MSDGDKRKRSGSQSSRRARAASERAAARPKAHGGGALLRSSFGVAPVETLGEAVLYRAEGPLGADVRFLFVDEEDIDPRHPPEGEDRSVVYSYKDVLETARRAANGLVNRGVATGDKVLIVTRTGPAFLAAFLGCQLIGAIPVPAVPPMSLNRIDEYCARVGRLAANADAVAVVTIEKLVPIFKIAAQQNPDARRALDNLILGRDLLLEEESIEEIAFVRPDEPALIQYTSGSTGNQKGVVLTHKNLIENVRSIGEGADFREGDVALAWLPLYHDMGLIGHFLAAQLWGIPLIMMPPDVFVRRPHEWLHAIERYRGTASAAPNFAYNLCVKRLKRAEVEALDLSSWRVAFCGAEPIHPETVRNFIAHFEPAGFRASTFFPVYGMAELALAATFPPAGRAPVFDRIDRVAFERDGTAVMAPPHHSADSTMEWVSVGRALARHEIQVVGKDGKKVPDRHQGEIIVRGPSLMAGYYKNEVATGEAIRDGWLYTGDLGYLAEGELYVTGRRKELIIKGGKNLYPQDIEAAAQRVDGIRVGCCAAFGMKNESRGTEDLIVVCETRATDQATRRRMATDVKRVVLEATGASPDEVVLVAPGSVPKTSSGKIQRDLARQRFMKGELNPGRASTRTLVKLKLAEALQQVRTRAHGLREKLRELRGKR